MTRDEGDPSEDQATVECLLADMYALGARPDEISFEWGVDDRGKPVLTLIWRPRAPARFVGPAPIAFTYVDDD